MPTVPNSPAFATRQDVSHALRRMTQANPHEAQQLDPDRGSVSWIAEPWFECLTATFHELTGEMVRAAGLRAAANHPGIALWNLAEEIRKIDPDFVRGNDGTWHNQGAALRALKDR